MPQQSCINHTPLSTLTTRHVAEILDNIIAYALYSLDKLHKLLQKALIFPLHSECKRGTRECPFQPVSKLAVPQRDVG